MDQPQRPQQPQQSQQSQWSPPPQTPSGWGQTDSYAAPATRPGAVTFAGIFLIIMGVLYLLFAVLAFLGGAALGGTFGEEGGVFAGILSFFGAILLIFAVAQLAGGIGAMQGKNWGRLTGIVISVIVLLFLVLGLPAAMGSGETSSMVFSLALIVLYGLTIWALAKAGPYFASRR